MMKTLAGVWLIGFGMSATGEALQDPPKQEDDKFKAATALSLLKDAQDQVKEIGENAELLQIQGTGLGENGTFDLTKEGRMLSYYFKIGEKFWSLTYIGNPAMKPNPMEDLTEETKPKRIEKLSKLKAISKEDIAKLKDTPELVKIAKGEGLILEGESEVYWSYDRAQLKVEFTIAVGEASAILEATTGKLKLLSGGKNKGK